ncbi:MAG: O-antigen ligase family protein [Armatimonadetes bacterium]|nr:O-antigen ligase family protein [Armatimonadota bacterium]
MTLGRGIFNRTKPVPSAMPGHGAERMNQARSYFRATNRPLAIWGFLLLVGALVAQLLPPVIRSNNVFNGGSTILLGLYSLIGFLFLRNSFRITFPIFVLGLIQIWSAATVFLGPPVLALDVKLGRNIWWPTFVMMPYLAAFVLCAIDTRWRSRLLNFILGVALVCAVVGLMQFLKLPGMDRLTNLYVNLDDLATFGLESRSHGLSTHPYHLSAQCILGMGIVASNLMTRKLKTTEILMYAILSSGLIVAQARSFYIAWAVLTLITVIMIYKRDKAQFFKVCSVMAAVIVLLVVIFPEKLSYGLSGKNTINEGRMSQWMRADELSAEFPITGIGPKETVFGSGKDLSGGGRWWTLYTESGYRMARVSGGFIELGLLILLVLSSLYLSFKVAGDSDADPVRRRAAFAGVYYVTALGVGLYITNILENELMTYYGLTLAALIAPQVAEVWKYHRDKERNSLRRLVAGRRTLSLKGKRGTA